MTQVLSGSPQPSRPPHKLEREESQLWRWILLFMVLLALGFAALAWERLETLPYHLGPMALGVLVLSILLAVYAYGRRKEVSELKLLLQDLQEHVGAAPSEAQLDQLIRCDCALQPQLQGTDRLLRRCGLRRVAGRHSAHGQQKRERSSGDCPTPTSWGKSSSTSWKNQAAPALKPDLPSSWRKGTGRAPYACV